MISKDGFTEKTIVHIYGAGIANEKTIKSMF